MVLVIGKTNHKPLLAFMFIMIFILCSSFVEAVAQIDIDVNAVFNEGEPIKFLYNLISDKDETIKYISGINCESIPKALLELKELPLKENQPYLEEYSYGILQDIFPTQNCTAYVSILEPYQFSASKPFIILAKTRFFDFNVDICREELCIQKAKVFVRGEDIYLIYNSSAEDLTINAFLKYPDGNIQTFSLPTSIKAEQIGTYEIEALASKEGYKNMTIKKQFGVIEKEPNIKLEREQDITVSDSSLSGKDFGKNDSLGATKTSSGIKTNEESDYNKEVILLIFIMIIIIVIFLFVIYKISSKRYKAQDLAKHQAEKMNDFNKEKVEELMRRRGWIR